MFKLSRLRGLDDYFINVKDRGGQDVYCYRINGFSDSIRTFLVKYLEAARISGVCLEKRIANPDDKNLSYYNEMMGSAFQLDLGFITNSLKKWLPRMNSYQCSNVAAAMFDTLKSMHQDGKNENMLRNAYIKFMCWLYFKFERVIHQLGADRIPKILYEGNISNYELKLLAILAKAGCDVLLLQYQGDQNYLQLDPGSILSTPWQEPGMQPFPPGFEVKTLRQEQADMQMKQRLYGTLPQSVNATNSWMSGQGLTDVLLPAANRGTDPRFFYNSFIRICGVWDKLTYVNDLYQFQLQLKSSQRNPTIVEQQIPPPNLDEISQIRRSNQYRDVHQLLLELPGNIINTSNVELQRLMIKAFVDIILEESEKPGISIQKLTNQAVYLICWLKRYQSSLFSGWKLPNVSCFIYLGGCQTAFETLFLRMLARLPVDVLILIPDLNRQCMLADSLLYDIKYTDTMTVDRFPREDTGVQIGTAAYHAERELDHLMYQDSGMYRNMQYSKAVTLTLQTMYEEIAILWDQELKYRPNFSTVDNRVNLPVIFAKISGVKDGNVAAYWQGLKALMTKDTIVIKNAPMVTGTDANPLKAFATDFYKNGRLQKDRIKAHKAYRYGVLRDEMQDYILDKLALLIENKIIRGTMVNGTEYTIISIILNLSQELIRSLQSFDFTKKNPKLIYINTTERIITLEDSIITAFLNLVGFDVLFLIPTGYQNIEKFFTEKVMEEHQIGEYLYDLQLPNFDSLSSQLRQTWREIIFKRGR